MPEGLVLEVEFDGRLAVSHLDQREEDLNRPLGDRLQRVRLAELDLVATLVSDRDLT